MLSSPYAEIKDSLAHFGADLKKSFVDSMKKTWKTLHEFALAHTSGEEEVTPAATDAAMEAVAEKLSQEQLQQKQEDAQHMRGELTFVCHGWNMRRRRWVGQINFKLVYKNSEDLLLIIIKVENLWQEQPSTIKGRCS